MRDIALHSPLVLCLLVVVAGAAASLIPVSPVEPILVGVATVAPTWLLLPLIALATVSHMSTKTLVFVGGAQIERAFTGRHRVRFERARGRLAGRHRLRQSTLFLSSVTGLPPFYLTTAVCGTLKMPLRDFLLLGTAGRAIRFAVLILLPQILQPAVGRAQTLAPAITVSGEGRDTYVLLSGMVGGVAGYRRVATRLVERGHRVVIIDPYQLGSDSPDVSFHGLARRVDAELAARGLTAVKLVGHAHGGGVALRLAANAPHRVSEVYLLDVGALAVQRTTVFSSAIRLVPLITRLPGGRKFIAGRYLDGIRKNSLRTEWLDDSTQRAYTAPMLDNMGRVVALARRLAVAHEPEPLADLVSRVRVPVTILLGEGDRPSRPRREEIVAL